MTRDEKEQFKAIVERLDTLENFGTTVAELEQVLPTLKKLAEAWEAASWFGKAIKWTGGIALALAAIVALFKLSFWNR